jgi:putative ABC transport system permease protein
MLRNFFTVAIRNILKQKFYSIINILGLTAGITASLFIILYIADELSYDKFHDKIDRMYRAGLHGRIAGQDIKGTWTPPPMAAAMKNDIPEISDAIRLWQWTHVVIRYEDKSFTEDRIFHTDSNFFRFFSFQLLQGDPETALKEPNSIVLTESSARKFFGNGEALGKLLIFSNDNKTMKVTGVAKDPPGNSHIKFNYLVSFSSNDFGKSDIWLSNSLQTYFIINPGSDISAVTTKINNLIPKYVGPQVQQFVGVSLEQFLKNNGAYGYLVDPVRDIHLYSRLDGEYEPSGNIAFIYIFGAIGLMILIIASINFMNLSTAKSSGRAREVGMRKTFGSLKSQLIFQFLVESVIYSFLAVILAYVLTIILLPQFNLVSGKILTRDVLFNPLLFTFIAGIILIVGILAGSYPAFYLTRFRIVDVFKGSAAKGTRGGLMRGILVTVQFGISIILIICTSIVYNQLQYTRKKDLGFDKEKVLVISNTDRIGSNRNAFKSELMKENGIVAASYSNSLIPGVNNTTVYRKPGVDEDHLVGEYYSDYEHMIAMGFKLAEGRYFSKDFPSDSMGLVVNQAVVKEMGWENPIGEKLISFNGPKPLELTVVGVLKDFNFESLKTKIRPLVIRYGNFGNVMAVRYSSIDPVEAVKLIERKWKEFASNEPFEYNFLDENFNDLYRAEMKIGKLLTIFSALAIFIACLGLFGLAAYTAEQRTREIGIRKAMGASSYTIFELLSVEFIKFVIIAFFISIIPAWYLISKWLENFVYHVSINYLIFIGGGLVALLIAILTVSYQSIKASRLNPAETLRYE